MSYNIPIGVRIDQLESWYSKGQSLEHPDTARHYIKQENNKKKMSFNYLYCQYILFATHQSGYFFLWVKAKVRTKAHS